MPSPCKKPPHSKAMYDAPITKVFPGGFFIQKISSELIPYSAPPGICGSLGLPPVAIRMFLAFTVSAFPSVPVSSI